MSNERWIFPDLLLGISTQERSFKAKSDENYKQGGVKEETDQAGANQHAENLHWSLAQFI